jgi:DNA-binding beta-propeller fold protein YncE
VLPRIGTRRCFAAAAMLLALCGSVSSASAIAAPGTTGPAIDATVAPGVPLTVPGDDPVGVALDPVTQTVYSANFYGASIEVYDAAVCTSTHRCSGPVAVIGAGAGSYGLALDESTRTLYVSTGGGLLVVAVDSCNAQHPQGCAATWPHARAGIGPSLPVVDQSTHTLYVGDDDGTTAVVDLRTCSASVSSGCSAAPHHIPGLGGTDGLPVPLALDAADHMLYSGGAENSLGGVDTRACNATQTSGCGGWKELPTSVGVANLRYDATTGTLYLVGWSTPGVVVMVPAATCNARVSTGCRHAPRMGFRQWSFLTDVGVAPDTHTIYVIDTWAGTALALPELSCNAYRTDGCGARGRVLRAYGGGVDMVEDPTAHTMVVAEGAMVDGQQQAATLTLLDTQRCNASTARGCTRFAPHFRTADSPAAAYVDAKTRTLYDSSGAVYDIATCARNGDASCQRVARIPHIDAAFAAAEPAFLRDPDTGTLVVLSMDRVWMVDAAHCNATIQSACSHPVPVGTYVDWFGDAPSGAVDLATHTLYVSGYFGLYAIDLDRCNAHQPTGCRRNPTPVIYLGDGVTYGVETALDPATHTLYLVDPDTGTLTLIDVAHCSAVSLSGCSTAGHRKVTVGPDGGSLGLTADLGTRTLYLLDYRGLRVIALDACTVAHVSGCQGRRAVGTGRRQHAAPRPRRRGKGARRGIGDRPGDVQRRSADQVRAAREHSGRRGPRPTDDRCEHRCRVRPRLTHRVHIGPQVVP